jgi:hypothetical protein
MEFECNDALPLVPAYLDGELSEARAGLLRKHLLGCHACRGTAQSGKTLQRWFAPRAEASADPRSAFFVAVPSGFAARVARRALAGDSGEREYRLPRAKSDNLLPFVLRATAIAAGLLFALAVGLQMQSRPETTHLSAESVAPPVEHIVEQFDQLNGAGVVAPDANAQGPALQVLPVNAARDASTADDARRGARRSKQQ